MRGVETEFTNYSGHTFSDFYVARDPAHAPGWFVFGRNADKYGTRADGRGAYVSLCARPDVKARAHPHYNAPVRRGWRTKREALDVCARLNAGER